MMTMPSVLAGSRVRMLAKLVAIGVAQAGIAVATVLLVRVGFDELVVSHREGQGGLFLWLAVGLACTAAASSLLRVMERVGAEQLGQNYILQVRKRLFRHISTLPPRALQRRSRGGMLLRFVGDLTALRQWVSLGLARLTVTGISTMGALLALAVVDWVLAVVVGGIIAAGGGLALLLGGRLQAQVRETRRRQVYLAANVSDKISHMAVVQAFGQSRRERRRIDRQGTRLGAAMVARARVTGELRAVTEVTTALATGAVLLAGALEVAAGQATAGAVVAAMTIVGMLIPPLRDLGRVHEYWHNATVSSNKIQVFLSLPGALTDAADAVPFSDGPGRLELDNVSVDGALANFSARVEPGQVVAIVGPNGAGKSTLLSLIARLTETDSGCVRVDGQDIARTKLSGVRRAIGIVGPDLPLLRGSIRKNLLYRKPKADQTEIDRVCKLCNVDEILESLTDGMDTRLAEGGANLSIGQRQRIALARALVGEPRILLLDEADANLDPKAARALDRVLAEYKGTVLLITHRPDWLASADVIWHLENGRLVESGTPGELARSGGPTARLFTPSLALAS